jgi:hypothetical protein
MSHDVPEVLHAWVLGQGVQKEPLQFKRSLCSSKGAFAGVPGTRRTANYLPYRFSLVCTVVSELYVHVQGTKDEILTRFHATKLPGLMMVLPVLIVYKIIFLSFPFSFSRRVGRGTKLRRALSKVNFRLHTLSVSSLKI